MSNVAPVLQALGRPAAVCLIVGLIEFLQDYQTSGKLVPSLISGGLVAAKTGAVWLGVGGAIGGVQTAQAKAQAAKAPAAGATP